MTNWHDFWTDPKRFTRLVSFNWKRPNTLRRPLCQSSIRRWKAVCQSSVNRRRDADNSWPCYILLTLSQITVDCYRSRRNGIGGDTQSNILIYRIRRYCKATSEYSPIRSIGLTLIGIFMVASWCLAEGYWNEHQLHRVAIWALFFIPLIVLQQIKNLCIILYRDICRVILCEEWHHQWLCSVI